MVHRTFPFRLHHILEEVCKDISESCFISWTPSGKTFKIHDLDGFKDTILPKYLPKQNKYKSFKRQLQYYGFTNYGSNQYGHPSFLRGQKSLICQIEHRAFKKSKNQTSSSSSTSTSQANDSRESLVPGASVTTTFTGTLPPANYLPGLFSLPSPSSPSSFASIQPSSTDVAPTFVGKMLFSQPQSLTQEFQHLAQRAQVLRALAAEQTLQGNLNHSVTNLAWLRAFTQIQF
jgi:hypothetical protein